MNKKSFFKIVDIIGVLIGVIVLTLLTQIIVSNIPYFADTSDEEIGGMAFALIYLIQTAIFLLPLFVVMKIRGVRIKEFGFVKIGWKQILKIAGLGYLAYISIMLVIVQIMLSYNVEIPGFGQQESHMSFLGEGAGVIVVIMIITLVAPILEEIFFRGFVFQTMAGKWPKWLAFVISAAIFASIHLEFQVFMPLFLLGLILNWMFFKSKSLYPGIFFHIVNNSIAISLEYYIFLHPEVLEMYEATIKLI